MKLLLGFFVSTFLFSVVTFSLISNIAADVVINNDFECLRCSVNCNNTPSYEDANQRKRTINAMLGSRGAIMIADALSIQCLT
jgi:hypothetical protein